MTTRTKTTAVALTGAVALASGAYALGTQAGDGDAAAAKAAKAKKTQRAPAFGVRVVQRGPFGRDEGLQTLADKLSTTPAKLRAAFEALRQDKQDEFAQKLADELGIDASKVKSAFDELKPPGGPPAPPPGGPPPGPPGAKGGFAFAPPFVVKALADKLGIGEDKVRDALGGLSPDDIRAA